MCIDEDEHQLASVALDQLCASGLKMNCVRAFTAVPRRRRARGAQVLLTTLMKGFIRSKRLDLAMNLCAATNAKFVNVVTNYAKYCSIVINCRACVSP